jgi:hypothetical protein
MIRLKAVRVEAAEAVPQTQAASREEAHDRCHWNDDSRWDCVGS